MRIFRQPLIFDWDKGNKGKNLQKHKVSNEECEEVFFDSQKRTLRDELHSVNESRFILLGKTKNERILFIVFTTRKEKIRVISARDLNKKEKKLYL